MTLKERNLITQKYRVVQGKSHHTIMHVFWLFIGNLFLGGTTRNKFVTTSC